jgi:hypothetical protein
MCFDPISLALLAASTAASVGGGIMQRNEANANNARVAEARNQELRDMSARLRATEQENALKLNSTMDQFTQPGQEKAQADANAERDAGVMANTAAPVADAGDIPLAGSAPKVIKDNIASRMLTAFQGATDKAKAVSKLGSYGDVWGANNRAVGDAGRQIDTNNAGARAWAGLLPSLQDFAQHAVTKPSSGIGETMQAVGQLGASAAGGGFFLPKGARTAGAVVNPAAGNPMWGGGAAGTNSGGWY